MKHWMKLDLIILMLSFTGVFPAKAQIKCADIFNLTSKPAAHIVDKFEAVWSGNGQTYYQTNLALGILRMTDRNTKSVVDLKLPDGTTSVSGLNTVNGVDKFLVVLSQGAAIVKLDQSVKKSGLLGLKKTTEYAIVLDKAILTHRKRDRKRGI